MTREEILGKVTIIFRNVVNDSNLVINESLTSDDIDEWDSITLLLIIANLEEEFGIKFKLLEIDTINGIKDFIDIIESKLTL